MNTMPINQEQSAVEYRLAEIEDETSQAHRDHAFEYWWHNVANGDEHYVGLRGYMKRAFDRAHWLYCRAPKIVKVKPSHAEMFALYAIGVVSGVAISFIAAIYILS